MTVQAVGTLALNVNTIADDDTINIAEKGAGFTISGDTGTETDVSVSVEIGTTTFTATSADVAGTATWSVSVPADSADITGTSVDVTVSASKTGFTAPADVERTLTVDLTAPTAPTYTAPASLKVGEAIAEMSPSGGIGIDEYAAAGLPSGLNIDSSTGAISGTPDAADANTASATVTGSDTAGNAATVDITFPAVAKGDQTLSGFQYGAASVVYGSTAPTVTAPTGAQTTLGYSATPETVCTVDATTGALTLIGAGDCVITATAASTDDYDQATATYTVTVQAVGTLALNVDVIATDDTINIAEREAGFTISGDTGTETGVSVSVEIGSTTFTATSADVAGTATWSVRVPADSADITGTSVDVTVSASKTGFTAPADVERTLTVDLTAPTAPTYTAPASLKVGEAIAEMSPSGGIGIDEYAVTGLPSGLSIDTGTGAISGTPDAANASTSDATVTVSDAAGNTATVSITFPVVAKGDQTLSGFQYSASSVTIGSVAPTVTAPTGAQTTLGYSATPATVCTVSATTGALTLVRPGACVITAIAAGTENYNETTATFTVTVQAAGTLVLNVSDIAGDNTINIAERAAGFTIGGDTGSEGGVSVTVTVGATELTAASSNANPATWSVSVPADAPYVTGTSVDVTVSASKTGFTAPTDVERTLTVDLTAPTAPAYTAPLSLKVGEAITVMNPSGGVGIDEYAATGLPSGLVIDGSTGAISGTPDTAETNTANATVTVSDTAGNTATVDITFPAVAKGDQTLSGFEYSASSVTFGSVAPTVTAPTGVQTTLSYSATPATVCTVSATTGALTLVGPGACVVTATAVSTDNYNEAAVTFAITVQAADSTDGRAPSTEVVLTVEPATVEEGAGPATLTVTATLDEAPRTDDTTLTLTIGAGADSAVADTDYAAVDDLKLTIEAGQTSGSVTLTLTPTDDGVVEGDETLTLSGASGVEDLTVTGTIVTITDDDERGVSIEPYSLTVAEGDRATYTAALTSRPTGTVRVTISGTTDTDLTLSRSFLSFSSSNWNAPQTVTVTARQDADADDDTVTIVHGVSGADYEAHGVTAGDVSVTVDDDDVISTGVELSLNRTSVDEDAGFTGLVLTGRLNGIPRDEPTTVAVSVGASDDAAVVGTDYAAVDELSLTIPAGQANARAIFVFRPLEDRIDERIEAVSITGTTEVEGFEVAGTTLSIVDNDERGVEIDPAELTVPEGDNATYTVVLMSQPTGDVTVTPTAPEDSDVTLSEALTFTATDWDEPQTVTVAAAHDDDAANDTVTIGHAVAGADYGANSAAADDVAVTVSDDETSVLLTVGPAVVDEGAEATTVTVHATLDGEPRDEPTPLAVTVGAADDTAVAGIDYVAVEEQTLTIPSGESSATATFTLTPVDNFVDAPDKSVSISGTTEVVGLEVTGTSLAIADNDERGVTVAPSAITLAEGASATYTVALDTEPTDTVTVTPTPGGSSEVTVSEALTFTAADWDEPQTVTVAAARDADAADDTATIGHAIAGADYGANGVTADDVAVTVEDTETTLTLTVDPAVVDEDAGPATVTVTGTIDGAPSTEPTTLTVSVGAADDEALVDADYAAVEDLDLTIPAGEASGTATFTLTITEDLIDEPGEAVSIAGSTQIEGFEVIGTALSIADNDERGLTVSATDLTLTEGESVTYTVVLDTEPTDTVTVTPTVRGSPDLAFEPATLTFTASDWDTAQTMTVTATEDDDAYHDSSVVTHAAEGADYASLVGGELSLTVSDNEVESQGALPERVTGVSATGAATHVDLVWPAVEGAVLGYRVEASYDGGANWAEIEANTGRSQTDETTGSAGATDSTDSTDSAETAEVPLIAYRHDVGLDFTETRLYRVSAVGENGAGLPSATLQVSATFTAAGLTAVARSSEDLLDSVPEEPMNPMSGDSEDPMSGDTGDSMSDDSGGSMSEGATDPMSGMTQDPAPAIDVCWIPAGVDASELSDIAIAWSPVHSSGSRDMGNLHWQSIGSGAEQVACEAGVGYRVTSLSDNRRYAFRMRARHDGVWLVSDAAQAVLTDESRPLRTVVTAGTSGLSGDTPAPELLCRNHDDPATREAEDGSFFLSIGFTTVDEAYLRYEPVNGFDPAADLTLENATAELVNRPYDTRLGYRVRITPVVWGEPVAVSVAAAVVTHAETAVGNRASGEFRIETSDADDCETAAPEPTRRSQVTAVAISPDGDGDSEWITGEPIRVTLQFDERVSVDTADGVPGVALTLGQAATTELSSGVEAATTTVTATFSHVVGEDTLVFEHLVTAEQSPVRDISLVADSLSLNGGRIDSFSGPAVDLAHAGAAVLDGQIEQPDLSAAWSKIPGAHEGSGSAFDIHLRFSEDVDPIGVIGERNLLDHAFTVTGGAIEAIGPARDRQGEYLANEWTLRVAPDSDEPMTLSLVAAIACDQPGAICTIDDRPLTAAPSVTVHRIEQTLSVADTEVGEGPGAVLVFDISLTRPADEPVTVNYLTADGTATAGEDYEAVSGTLRIEAGQTSGRVQVNVIDDSHDEGEESLTLVLADASNARIRDGEALGVIVNSDPIPGAWLSRFGRAASDHVAQAVARRLERGSGEEHLKVGGVRLDSLFTNFTEPEAGRAASMPAASGLAPLALGAEHAPGLRANTGPDALPSLRDALMGSSFFYTHGGDEDATNGSLTAWGETASTRFSGSEGALSLDGEVTTAMLGLDKQYGRWLVGTTLSYSEGEGGYGRTGALGGAVQSTLTSLNPYAHFALNETTSLWGVIGHGEGRLRLTPQGADAVLETDLSNRMAAFGGRGLLSARTGRAGRFELALRSDALLTHTDSGAVQGLMSAQGATGRVRMMLEGSASLPIGGGTLQPTVEAGLRYDGGDAETGAGIELGGGLGYAAGRFALQVNARGLVAHEDADYEEWGFSAALKYQPRTDERGLSMSLGSAWGATQSGVASMWSRADASGIARGGAAMDLAQRFQAQFGYGLEGPKGRALWVPFVAAEAGQGGQQSLRMGVKLTSGSHVEAGLEIGQQVNARGEAGQAVQLRGSVRW